MNLENEHSILASSSVLVTNASHFVSITSIDNLVDHMTISITNVYRSQLSLSFLFNVGDLASIGNSLAIVLPNNSSTQYAFPTRWARRIYVGLNIDYRSNKIEGSLTSPPNIDVNYVDNYFVLITCFFENIGIFDCNIDLFK